PPVPGWPVGLEPAVPPVPSPPLASAGSASTTATSSHCPPSTMDLRSMVTSKPCPFSHLTSTQTISSSPLWNTLLANWTGIMPIGVVPSGPFWPDGSTCTPGPTRTELRAPLSFTLETAVPTSYQLPLSSVRSSTNCSDDPSNFSVFATSHAVSPSLGSPSNDSSVTLPSFHCPGFPLPAGMRKTVSCLPCPVPSDLRP